MLDKPILVVRPLREDDAFLKLLEQASIPFKYIPIMKILPVVKNDRDYESIARVIDRLQQFDQVIVISANAAEIGLPIIAQRWPELPKEIDFLAVGQQTADVFSEYNYSVSFPEKKPNTEGLLEELPQLQDLKDKSVLILRGGQGRQTLGEELIRRGAMVEYCELYQRQIQSHNLVQAKKFMSSVGCLVVHSGELLKAMDIPADKHIPLVVPSDRIAQKAHELGYLKVQVAENALPQSMYKAVLHAVGIELNP
ncbi:MAG: uroporphyrinogen-III synthase [Porticoccaceae bacterium]|nr:uroporphyrinogen-III synthase [Porticoccaceae bacterium]